MAALPRAGHRRYTVCAAQCKHSREVWYDRQRIRLPTSCYAIPTAILHDHLPLIVVAEAWLLNVLLADATTAGHLVRLDDHVAAVAPTALEPLLTRLRALGHTPKVVAE